MARDIITIDRQGCHINSSTGTASCLPFPPLISTHIKQHQIDGIKFLWSSIVSPLSDSTVLITKKQIVDKFGRGCIIAHAMGLGKTMQIIGFLSLLFEIEMRNLAMNYIQIPLFNRLTDDGKKIRLCNYRNLRVLIITPATTIENWINEWLKWTGAASAASSNTDNTENPFADIIYHGSLNEVERLDQLKKWYETGGVYVIGYELFRDLVRLDQTIFIKPTADGEMEEAISYKTYFQCPGPDIIVCDEAHRIKNRSSIIYSTLSAVNTPFRICLSGYPLQNSLTEYFSMVDFVRPGYLGDEAVFKIKYEIPITNGLSLGGHSDARKYGRQRLFVLHNMIDSFVFRLDTADQSTMGGGKYSNIFNVEKKEIIIRCALNPFQFDLYQFVLESHLSDRFKKCDASFVPNDYNLFLKRIHELRQIINHPCLLSSISADISQPCNVSSLLITSSVNSKSKKSKFTVKYQSSYGTASCPIEIDNSDSEDNSVEENREPNQSNSQQLPEPEQRISIQSIKSKYQDHESPIWSSKLMISLDIIKQSILRNEKVLLFSYYVVVLNYIEKILNLPEWTGLLNNRQKHIKYVRMDGQIPPYKRQRIIDEFNNDPSINLFLISTRSGSLGINLQTASRVILFDCGFNPCNDEQAVARAYRYGQTKDVYVYRLHGYDSIEDTLSKRCIQKIGLSRLVVDKKDTLGTQFTKKELANYFKMPEPDDTENYEEYRVRKNAQISCYDDAVLKSVLEGDQRGSIVDICNYNKLMELDYELNGEDLKEAIIFYEKEIDALRKRTLF